MKYTRKRIEVEAFEFTGGNYGGVDEFIGQKPGTTPLGGPFKLETLNGVQRAYPGDLIVKLKNESFTIMKKEDFQEMYEEITEEEKE